ncbi:MAG: putative PEP-binding protein [Parvularculaceae bacterium]
MHEFLPHSDDEIEEVAKGVSGMDAGKLKDRAHKLRRFQSVLGHRGCRLGVSIRKSMRCRRARLSRLRLMSSKETERHVEPEIMVPLVADVKELAMMKARIGTVAGAVFDERGEQLTLSRQHDDRASAPRSSIGSRNTPNSSPSAQ